MPDRKIQRNSGVLPGHPLGTVQQFLRDVDLRDMAAALSLYSHRAVAEYSLGVLGAEVTRRVEESRTRGGIQFMWGRVKTAGGDSAVVEMWVRHADGSRLHEEFHLSHRDGTWRVDRSGEGIPVLHSAVDWTS